MNKSVREILDKNGFFLETGEWYSLTSAISTVEADFLTEIVKKINPETSLEIGCAEGVSSMVICDSVGPANIHTILDPNQTGHWKGMGLNNLTRLGFGNINFIEDYSEFVLPDLLKKGNSYDFIFVDGWHTFDQVLLEFYYINRLLVVGGIVAFDDTALPPINRAMRYISNYPNFEVIGAAGEFYESKKRKRLDSIKSIINTVTAPIGNKIKKEFLNDMVVRSNQSIKINGSITAFRKTANDERGWAWYESF